MLCIIAGTGQQADEYARSINLKRNEYRYVWNPDILKGTPRGLKFVKVGTMNYISWTLKAILQEKIINNLRALRLWVQTPL
jgi:hypothetical protein